MTDTGIAQDYLTMLLERIDAGRLDPAQVDWPFALEAWRAVREEQSLLRREQVTGREPHPVPQWLLDQHNVHLRPCPFCEADAVQLVSFAAEAELDMRYFVQCETCAAQGPIALYSQPAVAGWNRVQKELERLPGTGESE